MQCITPLRQVSLEVMADVTEATDRASDEEAVARIKALRSRIERDNETRRSARMMPVSYRDVTIERGGTTEGEVIYDRSVFSMQPGKRSLLRVVELEAAYDRIAERDADLLAEA